MKAEGKLLSVSLYVYKGVMDSKQTYFLGILREGCKEKGLIKYNIIWHSNDTKDYWKEIPL